MYYLHFLSITNNNNNNKQEQRKRAREWADEQFNKSKKVVNPDNELLSPPAIKKTIKAKIPEVVKDEQQQQQQQLTVAPKSTVKKSKKVIFRKQSNQYCYFT